MNCLAHLVKYILWIFNVAFLLGGIALIIIGSIMLTNLNDFTHVEDVFEPRTLPILIIIFGSVVFIVSFFGCCGAIRENVCCITTYSVFMFIFFCLQMALVIWAFVSRDQFLNTMKDALDKTWQQNDSAHGYPMDVIQISFKCCGYYGPQDYLLSNKEVPKSCCGDLYKACPATVFSTKPGCYGEYMDFWKTNINVIRYVGIVIALIELVAFIFACCLASNIRKTRAY